VIHRRNPTPPEHILADAAVTDPPPNQRGHEPHRLAQVLSRAEYDVTRRVAAVLEQEGSTVEEWRAHWLLADQHSRTMSEVAEVALLPAASLTRLIDRMVADNLVYRRGDLRDRRRVLVRITRRGMDQYRRLLSHLERDNVFDGMGAELVQLTDLLNAMLDRLRASS
jgi:DNA-binding MarR family transcriptional regulator